MSTLLPALLAQSIYYLPSVLAHGVVLGLAAWLSPRARTAAIVLAVGTGCQLLASLASFGTTAAVMASADFGWSVADLGPVLAVSGALASLVRAVGELLVAAAVYLAVTKGAPGAVPVDPVDPYGYRRG